MGLIKMNGVNYWGSAYGQGIIAPMIYSTEEKEVGVWTDGKPLYQKTFTFSFTCTSNDQTTTIETLASDIDVKIISEGYVSRDNARFKSGIYPPADIYYIFRINGNDNSLDIRVGNSDESPISGNVTIQYTKTTDTAGSGIYTPSGALAVHYSTNEQVIGTWIDGKPLYERTKVVPFANFTHNNDTYFTPIASDNTEILRNVEAIAYSIGYGVCTLGSRAYSRDNTLSYYWELVECYSNVALHFVGESVTDVGVTEVVITYQYTKTTD